MFGPIRNPQGERLDYVFTSGAQRADCLVILGHGVTANKDRSWALTLAAALDQAGFATVRFSFAGNGRSEGAFGESTIRKEVTDLTAVLDAAAGFERIAYVGHSMGGAVGVLAAARDSRIQFLVSLAGMVHVEEFAQRKFGELTPDQDLMWDKQECPLSSIFMTEMKELGTVVDSGAAISQPWLLLHGTADTVVLPKDSADIVAKAGKNASLITVDGADHLFSGSAEAFMAEAVVRWLIERTQAKA